MSVCTMHAGRGDLPIADSLEPYGELQDTVDSQVRAAGQMMENALLADYLEDGLRLLADAADGSPRGALRASAPSTDVGDWGIDSHIRMVVGGSRGEHAGAIQVLLPQPGESPAEMERD